MTTTEMLKIQFYDSYNMLKEFVRICPDDLWKSDNHGLSVWNHVIHTLNGSAFWLRLNYHKEFIPLFKFPDNLCEKLRRDEWCDPDDGFMTKSDVLSCFDILDKHLDNFWNTINDNVLNERICRDAEFTYLSVISAQIRHIMCHVGMCNAALIENGIDETKWIAFGEK